jgi:hypothetical protein
MLWTGTLAMIAQRPFAGWGPETFSSEFTRFSPRSLSAAYPDFYHESAHNIFLDTAAAQGLPAAVLLAALCALGLVASLRLRSAPLAAGIVAVIVAHQFSAFTLPGALVLYALIALAVATQGPVPLPPRTLRAAAALPAIAWLLFAAGLALWDARLARTDSALRSGSLDSAAKQWEAARSLGDPLGLHAELWYSRRLLALTQSASDPLIRGAALQRALVAGTAACHTADDPQNAWYHLATLYALAGDAPKTEHALRASIDAAPGWFKARWTLARLLLLSGRVSEAAQQAGLAAKLGGDKYPDVMHTLAQTGAAPSQK